MRQRNRLFFVACVALVTIWMMLGGEEGPDYPPHSHPPPEDHTPKRTAPIHTPVSSPRTELPTTTTRRVEAMHSISRESLGPLAEVVCTPHDNNNTASPLALSSVTLSEVALARITRGELYPKLTGTTCSSDRFLLVNTHTYGRHHNQLQEIMNTILWAHKLNRTAVVGWFRNDYKWVDPRDFYDFSEIEQRYCVVFHDALPAAIQRAIGSENRLLSSRCLGQGFSDLPLKKMLKGLAHPCPNGSLTIPAQYTSRFGLNVTQGFFSDFVVPASDGLLVIGGQVGFFMRAGLLESAAAFKWLRPSIRVKAALGEQPPGRGGS